MRIGLDAMGGDFAPAAPAQGALAAKGLLGPDDEIVLLGDETVLRTQLPPDESWKSFIRIEPTDQVIAMDDPPVEALRSKPNSSIARMAEMAGRGELDAIISAGNTGACVAAAQMRLRRLPGVHRPGIAALFNTFQGPTIMCDVGANLNCRPAHLYQYGVMASEYTRGICNLPEPRVGLLSIGEEESKGNQLVKETRALLRGDAKLKFIGNIEGRDIHRGVCDVIVSEGFVGNVCLKLMEGLGEGLVKALLKELMSSNPALGAKLVEALKTTREKFDFNAYGGAPLLGADGICIICHGASQARALTNSVRVAKTFAAARINQRITERLARHPRDVVHE